MQATVTKPDGSKDIDAFIVDPFGGSWAQTIQSYDTNGTTLLSTVINNWTIGYTVGSVPCELVSCREATVYYGHPVGYEDVELGSSLTTRPTPGGGNITEQSVFTWAVGPQTGLPASIQEWGYRNGTASTATFPAVPDRATYLTYAAISGNPSIINRVATKTVCNNVTSSPADPYCPAGATTVARTTTTYDAYDSNGSSGLEPPAGVGSIQNQDGTGHGTGYTARGNPTQISNWVSGSTYLTTALSYDTTGQVIASRDPNLNYTYYYYSDDFSFDDGENPPPTFTPTNPTNAYLTIISDNIGLTHAGYYYGSGHLAWTWDYNYVPTYFHYIDPFDRPTETNYAIGWSLNTYTSPTEVDSYSAIGDTTASASCVSCSHTQALLDTLGRVTSQSLVNNPSGKSYETASYD
jgi:hypothetical protein